MTSPTPQELFAKADSCREHLQDATGSLTSALKFAQAVDNCTATDGAAALALKINDALNALDEATNRATGYRDGFMAAVLAVEKSTATSPVTPF